MSDDFFPSPLEMADIGANFGNAFREKCIHFYLNHPFLGGVCTSVNSILR